MYNIKRKEKIISLLESEGEVDVNSLSELFATSKETIRRDLSELSREGIITRTHGGAVYNSVQQSEPAAYPVAIRSIQRYEEKNIICKHAATLIKDGDTVFVDNSSTTMYFVKYIPRELSVTIITNSLKLLLEAAKVSNPNIHCLCLGGIFRESNLSFYGSTTLKNAQEYYPNKAFISCAGIRSDGLVTDSSMQEVDTKRLMIEHSHEIYFLADYTKFSSVGQVYLTKITEGNTIITDSKSAHLNLDSIINLGSNVVILKQ